jgi:hypothetical protein
MPRPFACCFCPLGDPLHEEPVLRRQRGGAQGMPGIRGVVTILRCIAGGIQTIGSGGTL